MANTCKTTTQSRNSESKSLKILDSNTRTIVTIETLIMNDLVSLQETINKQGEEIGALIKDNAKLQVPIVENEKLKSYKTRG